MNNNTKQVTKKQITHFTMRIENALYEIIKENAQKNKRSIAKEIEYELEQINKK